jgi:hypothetical protein
VLVNLEGGDVSARSRPRDGKERLDWTLFASTGVTAPNFSRSAPTSSSRLELLSPLTSSPPSHSIYEIMFQRTILRASRQQAARQIRPFAPLRQQVGITRAAATPAIRWYSDAAPAKEGEAAEPKEEAPAAKDDSAQLIEKKDKEIVELKVRQDDAPPPRSILTTYRINTSAQ